MNGSYKPLHMPSVGGGNMRRRQWRQAFAAAGVLLLVAVVIVAARPRTATRPIEKLEKNGVHGVYNLHKKNSELLLYNFRAVEDGKVYRCSRLPKNHRGILNGRKGLFPAAFFGDEVFEFLRARNIHTVITLDSETESYALKGYFDSVARRKGYRIRVISYPVAVISAYSHDPGAKESGLRRAAQFIRFMKSWDGKGAVLLMGDSGTDAVGIVSAAYELWRNTGTAPDDVLWGRVKARYLVSDVLIKRDKDAKKFSTPAKCSEREYTFACPASIDELRPDLERIAQMD